VGFDDNPLRVVEPLGANPFIWSPLLSPPVMKIRFVVPSIAISFTRKPNSNIKHLFLSGVNVNPRCYAVVHDVELEVRSVLKVKNSVQ